MLPFTRGFQKKENRYKEKKPSQNFLKKKFTQHLVTEAVYKILTTRNPSKS